MHILKCLAVAGQHNLLLASSVVIKFYFLCCLSILRHIEVPASTWAAHLAICLCYCMPPKYATVMKHLPVLQKLSASPVVIQVPMFHAATVCQYANVLKCLQCLPVPGQHNLLPASAVVTNANVLWYG